MPGVIPAPMRLTPAADAPFAVGPDTSVTYGDDVLKPIAESLARRIGDLIGSAVPARQTGQNDGDVHLALGHLAPDQAEIPIAHGLEPSGPSDERHSLTITGRSAVIVGATAEAVFRGTVTLYQLLAQAAPGLELEPVVIHDGPLLAWRGLSLDVARTFFSVDEVKSVIDLLALYKMNVLHLHLTDHEGWRIQIDGWPLLTEIGGRGARGDRPGGFYSKQDYSELVAYAESRFVTIVPEIDLPGHTAAVFRAYPDLATPEAALDPDNPRAMRLVRDVLSEVSELTPGRFLHIGGDETFGMPPKKYERFVDETRAIVRSLGKQPIGWQEMSRSSIGENDILQYWIDSAAPEEQRNQMMDGIADLGIPADMLAGILETFAEADGDLTRIAEAGARMILSTDTYAYLDRPYAEKSTDAGQEQDRMRIGLQFYPPDTVRASYEWNLSEGIAPARFPANVAGVEAALWCETVESFADAQYLLLPRLAGIAEKSWSLAGALEWDDYRRRLARHAPLWERHAWNYFKSELVDWPAAVR